MQKYSIKRFSSSYSPKKYENADREEFEDDIDLARRGRENQALDEEAERIRWRSSLKKHNSRKGKTTAILGGPGGIAGKWVGDRVAESADESGKNDDEIKSAGNIAGAIAGVGAGIGAGYIIKKGIGDSADAAISAANKEVAHLEKYRHDIPAYTKMSAAEKKNITEGLRRNKAIIAANRRRSAIGKYAMPVLGIAGAAAAAKAVSDSLDDRLARRKAIDSENKRKAVLKEEWDSFKDKASRKLKRAGKYIKSAAKEDYREKED